PLLHFDGKRSGNAPMLARIAVPLLDAALRVATVAAHVPLAPGTRAARLGIGTPHDARHQVATLEAAARRRLLDPAERLVSEDQPLAARRRPAVLPTHDLAVRPADAHGETPHQQLPLAAAGLIDLLDEDRARPLRSDGERAH